MHKRPLGSPARESSSQRNTCASLNLPPIGPGADITTRQAAPSAEGEECGGEKSTPCSDGLICKKNNDKFLLSPGICKAVAYLGDKCGGEALTPCFTGLSCDLVNPKFLLSPGVCVEGEAIITR
ncbi:hypothetical protein BDV95DRAFT_62484 [Massariosphaeria phaeospora]|uniref:Uncharacterized protein n=1 Tax=Massariosphaeria phaeospora TaxID=100035 RepID=A0A7C8I492_9PLEO|nr:hypothetical protein BDV95DRAFT_62484 [Massariosphaeria phaeospora]